ncbi:DUF3854 domain-containing protein [Isoptericola croceus]|uniref:DUF3854 domain-containing protein n=1 Tax=Isoptericola croceus TaxID=3031406 RepID=UPI0023F8956C|nr:DUF3854 domain-containing protein [Isoptericola croceus]
MTNHDRLLTPWTPEDYAVVATVADPDTDAATRLPGDGLTGSGAYKLASSGVAPLVAAARGYRTFDPSTVAAVAASLGTDGRQSDGRQLKLAAAKGDALLMPWYRMSSRAAEERAVTAPVPDTHQLRPAAPLINAKGEPAKYVFLAGASTALDVHPAVPSKRMDTAGPIAFVEGLLKADSLLSAMLLDVVDDPEDLAYPASPTAPGVPATAAEARTMLARLIELLDPDQHPLVVAVAGVGNWRSHPEWKSLSMAGRDVWITFDGDVATNYNVWKQADELFDFVAAKKGTPLLVDLSGVQTPNGEKVGVDDYLALHGHVSDLPEMLTGRLPEQPARPADLQIGEWRVNEEAATVEECAQRTDPISGASTGAGWETRVAIAGRVRSITIHRAPSPREMDTGAVDSEPVGGFETACEIELFWRSSDGQVITCVVRGPVTLLSDPPGEWHRRGGEVPAELQAHPHWPPRKGVDWLSAIKAHRADETLTRTAWSRMGWVPNAGGSPVFVVGDQVLGATGLEPEAAASAVNEAKLSGASKFGLQLPAAMPGTPEGDALLRANVTKVLDVYARSGAWTNRRHAAAVLAAALRPVAPQRSRCSVFCVGPKKQGKSFTASMIMSPWQPYPGIWTENRLPGAAKDTMASIEHALSLTPIWVADDFAPSTDPRQADMEMSRLGDLVRSIHNGTGKRRMTQDLTSRHTPDPHALFVATAENDHPVASVRDRMVILRIGRGALSSSRTPTDELVKMRDDTGELSQVVGHMVMYLAQMAATEGWDYVNEVSREAQEALARNAEQRITARFAHIAHDNPTRYAGLAGDLALGLWWLKVIADQANIDAAELRLLNELRDDVADLLAETNADSQDLSPGASLVRALGATLAAGKAHVLAGDDATAAPYPEDPYASTRLGWRPSGTDGDLRPSGPTIGTLVTDNGGDDVVIFDKAAAFRAAMAAHPELIPHGTAERTSWSAVVDEELTSPTVGEEVVSKGKQASGSVRVRIGQGTRVSGVPVSVAVLQSAGTTDQAGLADIPEDEERW